MDRLVVSNVVARPTRTLGSVFVIALGVLLVGVTIGLARGMLRAAGERESNVGAELIFQTSGSFGAGVAHVFVATGRLRISDREDRRCHRVEGVVFAHDIGENAGVASYPDVTGIRINEGRAPRRNARAGH